MALGAERRARQTLVVGEEVCRLTKAAGLFLGGRVNAAILTITDNDPTRHAQSGCRCKAEATNGTIGRRGTLDAISHETADTLTIAEDGRDVERRKTGLTSGGVGTDIATLGARQAVVQGGVVV